MTRPTLLLLFALLAPGLGLAIAPSAAQAQPANLDATSSAELAASRKALLEARQRVAEARTEVAEAELAYRKWTQRRRPRGEARAEVIMRLDEAQTELAAAEEALPVAMENARRAGLPPGEFRELEAEQPL